MDETLKQIGAILEEMGYSIEELQPTSTLTEDLGMDSMELTEFAVELESQFDITIPDDGVTPTMTLEQVAAKVKELKGE